jgi:hypothetical protein
MNIKSFLLRSGLIMLIFWSGINRAVGTDCGCGGGVTCVSRVRQTFFFLFATGSMLTCLYLKASPENKALVMKGALGLGVATLGTYWIYNRYLEVKSFQTPQDILNDFTEEVGEK